MPSHPAFGLDSNCGTTLACCNAPERPNSCVWSSRPQSLIELCSCSRSRLATRWPFREYSVSVIRRVAFFRLFLRYPITGTQRNMVSRMLVLFSEFLGVLANFHSLRDFASQQDVKVREEIKDVTRIDRIGTISAKHRQISLWRFAGAHSHVRGLGLDDSLEPKAVGLHARWRCPKGLYLGFLR